MRIPRYNPDCRSDDNNYNSSVPKIIEYLNSLDNFYTVGRFGEWTYYNMDKCIESAMVLSEKIKEKYNLKARGE